MSDMTIGDKLLMIRRALSLSRKQVAQIISVPVHIITYIERSPDCQPCGENRRKILAFIQENVQLINARHDDWIARSLQKIKDDDEARRKLIIRTFIGGKRYSIFNSEKGGYGVYDFNPITGRGCIFIYLRKDGKHHIFREQSGGWTRTYTDVQLIGKKIKEIKA